MSPSPNGLPPPMNLPPMSGAPSFPPVGPPGQPLNGQKNQMSDYINAALRSIEQSIETRDPSQPPMMIPPHFNPPGPFNPPPHHMGHQMGHFGQFDPSYNEMQFDETNPHHPAFHQTDPQGPPQMFGQGNFGPMSGELQNGDFQPTGTITPPPPGHVSGNELRPSDQTGPGVQVYDHVSGHMSQQLTNERVSFNYTDDFHHNQPTPTNQTNQSSSVVGGGGPEAKKQKFNSSPDSGSRRSISPRDSGYDT